MYRQVTVHKGVSVIRAENARGEFVGLHGVGSIFLTLPLVRHFLKEQQPAARGGEAGA